MKRVLLSFLLPMLAATNLSAQLIISQYYEGDNNDKYLEVTNLGNSSIDLAAMGLRAYLFANERADDPANNKASIGQALSGTIFPFESLVFSNGLAVQPGYTVGSSIGVNFCGFNGDDLVVLSTASDGLSVVGSAWANRIDVVGDGTSWGVDISYVRKTDILEPSLHFNSAEWTAVSLTTVNIAGPEESSYLGTHYSILPVMLADFKAIATATYLQLNFTTLTEQHNAYFLVQRSVDEGKTFQTIGQVAGQGDSQHPVAYEFIDHSPVVGRSYYRLQQFDYGGEHAFFGPVAAHFGDEMSVEISLWPVPARDQLKVALPAANVPWQVEVLDQNGRRLLQQRADEKERQLLLDVQGLRPGSYLLRWENGRWSGQAWFVKG